MEILFKYFDAFLAGALTTLKIAGFAWGAGITLGCALGFIALQFDIFRKFLSYFGFLLNSIPILVLLFWVHYPMQSSLNVVIDPLLTSIVLFTFINTLMVAQTISQNAEELPDEFVQCAIFAGLSPRKVFIKVQLPMVFRVSLPSIVMSQVTILHMTLFASLISVNELFRTAQRINSIEYQPVEIYTIIALFYIVISIPLLSLSKYMKSRLKKQHVLESI